jgi:hypothetical protein
MSYRVVPGSDVIIVEPDGTVKINDHIIQDISTTGSPTFAGITISSDGKIYFRDTGLYIYSANDGQLWFVADTSLYLKSDALFFGTSSSDSIYWMFDGSSANGYLYWKGDSDRFLFSDDVMMYSDEKFYLRDTGIYINSSTDGQLDIDADTEVEITTTTLDIDADRVNVSNVLVLEDNNGLLDTPVAGAIEFDNDRVYITNVGTQRPVDRTSDVITSTTTVSETTDETTIFTATIGANDLKAGNVLKFYITGQLSNATAADDLTITGYLGTTSLGAFNPAIGNVTDADWHVECVMTVRSTGETGSVAWHTHMDIDDNDTHGSDISTIDTTTAENFTVTITWDNAKAGNTISAWQGFMEYKN